MQGRTKTRAYIATAATLFIAAVAVIVLMILIRDSGNPTADSIYIETASAGQDSNLPLMQSDIANIFYTIEKDGTVTFYEYKSRSLTKIEPDGTVQVSPQCSGILIPATIYYVQRDGKTTGYGLYSPPGTGEAVSLYTYFFFHMRDLPQGYPTENGTQFLLLMDSESQDLYKQHKTYDESFYFRPGEEDILKRTDFDKDVFTSQVNRYPGKDGRYWSDFAVLTDDVLACAKDKKAIVFSSRQYTQMEEGKRNVDLYVKNGSALTRSKYQNISYMYAYENGADIHYMRKTETGFNLYRNDTVLKEFTGDYDTQYLRDGNYLFEESTGSVYNLLTGEAVTFGGAVTENAVLFAVNPSATKCIIGTMANNSAEQQSLIFCDMQTGTSVTRADKLLFSASNACLAFLDDDTYFHNTVSFDANITYCGRIFLFKTSVKAASNAVTEA